MKFQANWQIVPLRRCRHEIEVQRSRFIATADRASSLEEARALLTAVRAEFPEATHHVQAFVIGHGGSVQSHCHDDGEPSGSAGKPALAILQGGGLRDVALVVTRSFGGIKLGRGGLVRAYGDAVRELLKRLPLARKAPTHVLLAAFPYPALASMRSAVARHDGLIQEEAFAQDVTLTIRLPQDRFEDFRAAVTQLSNGRWVPEVVSSDPGSILPLS